MKKALGLAIIILLVGGFLGTLAFVYGVLVTLVAIGGTFAIIALIFLGVGLITGAL